MHVNADALALLPHLLDRVGVDRRQQLGQHFEDGDLGAGPRIDMAEFERDHPTADEQHALRQLALAQHLIGGDHQLGARDRQRPVLRTGGDDDVLGLERPSAGLDGVGADEFRLIADQLDAALLKRLGERVGDARDHLLLAVDQGSPVERGSADADAMDMRLADLVQRMCCGDQHLLRRAAAIGAGAAEIAVLDHDDLETGLARWPGDAERSVAATQDHHVIGFARHLANPSSRSCAADCRVRRGAGQTQSGGHQHKAARRA